MVRVERAENFKTTQYLEEGDWLTKCRAEASQGGSSGSTPARPGLNPGFWAIQSLPGTSCPLLLTPM